MANQGQGEDRRPTSGDGDLEVPSGAGRSEPPGPPAGPPHDRVRIDPSSSVTIDPSLAGLVEEITRRIQTGESIDAESLSRAGGADRDEIRGLIEALGELADFRRETLGAGIFSPSDGCDEQGGKILGDFRIVREIGRGGVGIIYEAEQLSRGRPVALKVLLGPVSTDRLAVRRFQLEAQVAGLLRHPRIVPIYTVGTIDRIPYLAMQLIEGGSLADLISLLRRGTRTAGHASSPARDEPLRSLADAMISGRFPSEEGDLDAARHGSGPDLAAPDRSIRTKGFARAVARLGVQAAEALGYAHEQGVTHRDVKPANLLLDGAGNLWVADFGMAAVRGEGGLTQTGDLPGTLRYMSPERATGRRALVDHRSDIYSLGVTMYELLALRPAFEGSDRQELLRRIAEEEPTPLRHLDPAVPTDLDTIVAKAMAKDPAARYETAEHLADDLGRFLAGRPIAARRIGRVVRMWHWGRRHPVQAGLSAALALALVGITWAWTEALQRGRMLAATEAKACRTASSSLAISKFLIDRILARASSEDYPQGDGRMSLREVLDHAASEAADSLAGDPEGEAVVRLALGKAYHGEGDYAKAEVQLRSAHVIFVGCRVPDDPGRLDVQLDLGHVLCHLGRLDEAEPLLRGVFDRSHTDPAARYARFATATGYYAGLLKERGRYGEAERMYRLHSEEIGRGANPDRGAILSAQNNLADLLIKARRFTDAEAILQRTMSDSKVWGPDSPGTLAVIQNLAIAELQQGKVEVGEEHLRECLARATRAYGRDHPAALSSQFNLASLLQNLGRFDEAKVIYTETLATHQRRLGDEHPSTLKVASNFAGLLINQDRLDDAEALLRPCLEVQRRVLGRNHPDSEYSAQVLETLGEVRRRRVGRPVQGP